MDDFWNISETTPATLDNFFDEESDVNWTGTTKQHQVSPSSISYFSDHFGSPLAQTAESLPKSQHKPSLSSGNLSTILDTISISSDSGVTGVVVCQSCISGRRIGDGGYKGLEVTKSKEVGKVLGEKFESLRPSSVTVKWKNDGSGSCLQCISKDEEIMQLKRRLERAYSRQNISLPPEDTIQKMILGQPYSLESYKIMEDKLKLLNLALDTLDTSTVLAVLLFLKNTLKKRIFMEELCKRPLAAQMYISFLKQRMDNNEVLDILGMLGRKEEAAMFKYELALASKPDENQIKNIRTALQSHFSEPSLQYEAKAVMEHSNLLELQMRVDAADSKDQSNAMFLEYPRAASLSGQSLLTTLYYCSMYHWASPETVSNSPLFLKKHFGISDKQFLWTVVRARAKVKHWPLPTDLEALMATKGIIGTLTSLSGMGGGGKIIKNSLPIHIVIDVLASTEAPSNVLSAFISLISSNEEKLKLGLKYNCHLAVIEAYVGQKDRSGLENYLQKMTYGSPEYIRAEQALKVRL